MNNMKAKEYKNKQRFEKHETLISITLIIIYVISNSLCIQNFGVTDYRSMLVNILLTIIIVLFVIKNKLGEYYGLTSFPKASKFIYFIPLIFLISVNFWNGITVNNTKVEIICYIISMICVGFLEEIIFRGFLFKMMEKTNVKAAVIVTSVTFGIGHIINLLNGAAFIPTLLQVLYVTSVGYLFVTIFQKSNSLYPCIITHSLTNAFHIFSVENEISTYLIPIFIILVSISYSIYIRKTIKDKE